MALNPTFCRALAFLGALSIAGCNSGGDSAEVVAPAAEAAPSDEGAPTTTEEPAAPASARDHSRTDAVVAAVFLAASSGDFSDLSVLCDPNGKADGDVQRICDLAEGDQEEFLSYFSSPPVLDKSSWLLSSTLHTEALNGPA